MNHMSELSYAIKVVFSKAVIREITWMYVHRRFAREAIRFIVAFVLFLCGCVYGILLPHTRTNVLWASIFGGLALAVGFLAWLAYSSVYKRLGKAYRADSKAAIEYRFTTDKIIISLDQKQSELFWTSIQEVWVSKNVLMLRNSEKRRVALPIYKLSPDQRSFVIERIARVRLFSPRERRLLSA